MKMLMMSATLVSIFSMQIASAFATGSDGYSNSNVVLGIDSEAFKDESPFKFPCLQYDGYISCDKAAVSLENEVCARTIQVKKMNNVLEISCRLKFTEVVIGYAPAGVKPIPGIRSSLGALPVKFAKGVTASRVSKRNIVGQLEMKTEVQIKQ